MEKIRNNIRGMVEQYLNENQVADIPKDTELFYKLKDNLIWVRVLSGNFFHQKDADNQNFGIGCQSGMANDYCAGQHGGLETYQLLRRVKDDDSYNFKTIGAITLNPQKDYVAEMRQRGNQPPGSNNVDEFSKEQLVDFFLDFLKEKFPNVDKFSDGPSLHVPSGNNLNKEGMPTSGHGWGAKSLWYIIKNFPGKFSKYMNAVPGIFVNQIDMIQKTLGEEFLLLDKDVKEIFNNNKYDFFNKIDMLLKTKKEETLELMKELNFEELLKDPKIFESIEKKLFLYIDFLSPQSIELLLKKLNIREFIKSSISNFGFLCKKLSEKGGAYKKILFNFINDNFAEMIESFGGKGVGLGKLMTVLNLPKYKKHEGAKYNFDTGDYEVITVNPETDEKIKKTISDDNLVFSSAERKKFLEQHKDEIKSFYNSSNQNPDIEYLRFLIPNLPEGSSKHELEKIKDEFIDYYDKKFDKNLQKFPGKFLYNQLINQLKYRLGEKPKKYRYDWGSTWITYFKEPYPFKDSNAIPSELNYNEKFDKNSLQGLLKYFYKNLKPEFGTYSFNQENNKFGFVPASAKSEQIKQIMSNYFYLIGALSGFGEEGVKNWMAVLKKNGFPIETPSKKVVSWAKDKKYFEEKEAE